jgi:hypothetical protein
MHRNTAAAFIALLAQTTGALEAVTLRQSGRAKILGFPFKRNTLLLQKITAYRSVGNVVG